MPPLHEGPLELDRIERDRLAACLGEIALAAGPAVMEVYASGGTVSTKSDGSPVTLADERAEAIICDRLARLMPTTPVVAEEGVAAGDAVSIAERFLLVDPLDGTKEFITRNGEFTINVALIEFGLADRRRGLCACAGAAVVWRRARVRVRRARRRGDARAGRLASDSHPFRAGPPRRHGEPVPCRRCDRGFSRPASTRRAALTRVVAEILCPRRGAGGRLSPFRSDHGMGHSRRRRRIARRRGNRSRRERGAAALWKG